MSTEKNRPREKAIARERGFYDNRIVEKGERFTITAEDADEIRRVRKENERLEKLSAVEQAEEKKAGVYIRQEGWIRLEADLPKDEKKELERAERIAADAAESEAKDGTARKR